MIQSTGFSERDLAENFHRDRLILQGCAVSMRAVQAQHRPGLKSLLYRASRSPLRHSRSGPCYRCLGTETCANNMLLENLPGLSQTAIVLASASPRRSELLQLIGLKPEVIPSKFEENLPKEMYSTAAEYAIATAKGKALDVTQLLASQSKSVDLIIGADTVWLCTSIALRTHNSHKLQGSENCSCRPADCRA